MKKPVKKTLNQIDRERFLQRLKDRVTKEKVVEITLKPDGLTLSDVANYMGNSISCVSQENGSVKIGVKHD